MGTLRVFSSEGTQIHPPDHDASEARYSNYFGTIYLKADFDDTHPFVECYVRVKTERRKEQVYVRYDGEHPDTLIEVCREAVHAELVGNRGWEFTDPSVVDPSYLFVSLIRNDHEIGPSAFANTPLASHERTIESVLKDGKDQIRIHARDFKLIVDLIHRYRDTGCSIAVVDRPDVDAAADLLLADAPIVNQLDLPDATINAIDQYQRRRTREHRQQQFSRVEDALAELADADTDADTVATALQQRVSRHFHDIQIRGPSARQYGTPTRTARRNNVRADGNAAVGSPPEQATAESTSDSSSRFPRRPCWSRSSRLWILAGLFALLVLIGGMAMFLGVDIWAWLPDMGDVPFTGWRGVIFLSGACGTDQRIPMPEHSHASPGSSWGISLIQSHGWGSRSRRQPREGR